MRHDGHRAEAALRQTSTDTVRVEPHHGDHGPHRESGTPLLVPLSATAGLTGVLEALTMPDVPAPHLLDGDHVAVDGPHRTITGINALIRRVAATMALPSELGVPWATRPYRVRLPAG